MELLNLSQISFSYNGFTEKALTDISFSVEEGEFIAICGGTGSGKSTLLRLLKPEISPMGSYSGKISFKGLDIKELSQKDSACEIGYVMQNPDQQIVTDKVWHELAFGLENLGLPQKEIAARVGEMAAYFGMDEIFEREVSTLSGGQKQILNLAAVMVMRPKILILDEPTAQLDPLAAKEFLSAVKRVNRELGVTVIIAEHRLEEVIPLCHRLAVMSEGTILAMGAPSQVIRELPKNIDLSFMPTAAKIFFATNGTGDCPISVSEGRKYIRESFKNHIKALPHQDEKPKNEIAIEISDLFFRYEKRGKDILKGLSLKVELDEIFCILGGNGAGKTTAILNTVGLLKPHSGKIKILGKNIKDYKNNSLFEGCVALLPQDVTALFTKSTVKEELLGAEEVKMPYDISHLAEKHPYDLSGGEQQLLALYKVMARKPKILLLDEPTKGLDSATKLKLGEIFKELKNSGMAIVMITHDLEFAATFGDKCGLFFNGGIISQGSAREFFSTNRFYTTASHRIAEGFYENPITPQEVAQLCLINGKAEV